MESPLGLPTPLAMLVERHLQWFRGWLGAQPRVRGGMKSAFIPEEPAEFKPAYLDRDGAGRELAKQLGDHIGVQTLVLALPRGGVEVALPIAAALGADFDVLVVRKIRAPFQPELGLGAVAEDGVVEWNEPLLRELGYGEPVRRRELELAHRQLADHVAIYRAAAPRAPLEDRTVILVDDGIATGGTVRAAIAAVKRGRPKKLIVALPGGDPEVLAGIAAIHGVDAVVAPEQPESFHAVSELYADYPPVPTEAVLTALREAHATRRAKLAAQG
ncbi:MAG: phosphoribosyltransferase [Planctomycetota bacterium]